MRSFSSYRQDRRSPPPFFSGFCLLGSFLSFFLLFFLFIYSLRFSLRFLSLFAHPLLLLLPVILLPQTRYFFFFLCVKFDDVLNCRNEYGTQTMPLFSPETLQPSSGASCPATSTGVTLSILGFISAGPPDGLSQS